MADPETNIYAVKEVEWQEAIKAEMEAIKRNSTCHLTELPEGKKSYWFEMDIQDQATL